MTAEKEICNTLEGLFKTLTNKFKAQYKGEIKSLLFRKLYRYDDENVEDWMETAGSSSGVQLSGS